MHVHGRKKYRCKERATSYGGYSHNPTRIGMSAPTKANSRGPDTHVDVLGAVRQLFESPFVQNQSRPPA